MDYSQSAIDLANTIVDEQGASGHVRCIQGDVFDPPTQLTSICDLINDKGTFDAISLQGDDPFDQYQNSVVALFKNPLKARLIITSCNWSRDELISIFNLFTPIHEIIHPQSFTFGGQTGQAFTTIVFAPLIN